jgi:hypothetical protein
MIPVPVSVAMGPDSIERGVNHRRDVQILQARDLDVASPSVLVAKGLTVGRARHPCRARQYRAKCESSQRYSDLAS